MSIYSVEIYQSKFKNDWNAFVGHSKNGTFLFHRDFMEYHQHRFEDYSLLIYKKKELVALLPANRVGDVLYSHQGLTYGGLVVHDNLLFEVYLDVFKILLKTLRRLGVNKFKIKVLPRIYELYPSDELNYLLFKLNATLYRSDLTSIINLQQKQLLRSSNRKRGLKRAQKRGLEVVECTDYAHFWNKVLIPNLKLRYSVEPVHSVEEILNLKAKFPEAIRLFCVYHKDELVAGAVIFESQLVAHAQYISANQNKQELGSLDLLFDHLITNVYAKKKYFDFGISNENQGQQINQGLLSWKESFGARSVIHQFYSIETQNAGLLNNVLI